MAKQSDRPQQEETVPAKAGKNTDTGILWGLLAACGLYLVLSLLTWNQIEEDSFIYFRAAANLAGGYGYVFNQGHPPVETGSSSLWLLMLTALHWLPVNIVTATKWLGIAFGLLSLVLTGLLARRTLARSWRG